MRLRTVIKHFVQNPVILCKFPEFMTTADDGPQMINYPTLISLHFSYLSKDDVWDDSQEEFVCNTLSPGCLNVCFNEYSPIALVRIFDECTQHTAYIACCRRPTFIGSRGHVSDNHHCNNNNLCRIA